MCRMLLKKDKIKETCGSKLKILFQAMITNRQKSKARLKTKRGFFETIKNGQV